MGFELLTTKTTLETKKNHHNSMVRDNLNLVFCFCFFCLLFLVFTVALVVVHGFWLFFLGCYSSFKLLGTKTTVEIQKNNEFSRFPSIASVGFAANPHQFYN